MLPQVRAMRPSAYNTTALESIEGRDSTMAKFEGHGTAIAHWASTEAVIQNDSASADEAARTGQVGAAVVIAALASICRALTGCLLAGPFATATYIMPSRPSLAFLDI